MTKILQRNLYREVADRIGDLIEHGELLPGERISEKQLCDLFGVSRTPLREALKVLATEGLLELLPNRGARVVRLTLKNVKYTYDLMAALEGLSGELACQYISDAEIAAIQQLIHFSCVLRIPIPTILAKSSAQTFTCVPISTTRPAGMWK